MVTVDLLQQQGQGWFGDVSNCLFTLSVSRTPEPGPGKMGFMKSCRTFHTTQGPGPGPYCFYCAWSLSRSLFRSLSKPVWLDHKFVPITARACPSQSNLGFQRLIRYLALTGLLTYTKTVMGSDPVPRGFLQTDVWLQLYCAGSSHCTETLTDLCPQMATVATSGTGSHARKGPRTRLCVCGRANISVKLLFHSEFVQNTLAQLQTQTLGVSKTLIVRWPPDEVTVKRRFYCLL